MFGSIAFKTPLPMEIDIFLEITAPDNRTPTTTSFIFYNESSLTRLGFPHLLKIGGRKSSFWLFNLCFQLLIDLRKKVYCGYFDLKLLTAACVPLLYGYFPTCPLAREGMVVLYVEPFLPFFLLKPYSSAFAADASAAITFPVALANSGITV